MNVGDSVCSPKSDSPVRGRDLAVLAGIRDSLAHFCLLCATPLKGYNAKNKERGAESRPLFSGDAAQSIANSNGVELLSLLKSCHKCKKSLKEEELHKRIVISLFAKPDPTSTWHDLTISLFSIFVVLNSVLIVSPTVQSLVSRVIERNVDALSHNVKEILQTAVDIENQESAILWLHCSLSQRVSEANTNVVSFRFYFCPQNAVAIQLKSQISSASATANSMLSVFS